MDAGYDETEELLRKMEKRINTQYSTANKELTKKLKAFMKQYDAENKAKQKELKAGKITEAQYDLWLKSQATRKTWLTEMVNTLSQDCTMTDAKAMSIVRGFMPEAYAINRNFGAYEAEKGALVATSFTLYDAHTVESLIENRPNLLPEPSPDIPKELRWHKQKITNAITQGILQGESIPDIAVRLQGVTDMDRNAAIRNARTATTGAQNAGRVDSYRDAEKMGIELKQEWLATLDGRTRDSHRHLDGERVDVGKKFSNGCRYPGDPQGPPEEVYNCRCTLVAAVEGIDQSSAPRFSRLENMSYDEWKWGKDGEEKRLNYELQSAQNKLGQTENKVYSGIWKDDVHLSDYAAKKDSIQSKMDYYNSKLVRLDQTAAAHPDDPDILSAVNAQKAEIAKHVSDLQDFQKRGEEYAALQNEISGLKKEIRAKYGAPSPFTEDAYSPERKAAARNFTNKMEADKFLRPTLDSQWGDLEDQEKYGVWEYTHNSNPINKPLSGYEESWSRSAFKGVGNADWQNEDAWRDIPSEFKQFGHSDGHVNYAATISGLTTGIEKCELAEDMWFVRGGGTGGLAGLLEGSVISFDDAQRLIDRGDIDTLRQIIQGQTFQSHSFLSTGIAKGTGFSGEVAYRIYAPAGTKCIYAEPQSYYGNTVGMNARLYVQGEKYSSVGSEAETIFQRGTYYRCADIVEQRDGNIIVTLEVVGQPDYFETGYEQTADNGATSFIPKKR